MKTAAISFAVLPAICLAVPADGQVEQRTLFGCILRHSTGKGTDPGLELSFLLSGDANSADEDAPIETFDPLDLLNGARFSSFSKTTRENGGYVLFTTLARDGKTYKMSLIGHDIRDMTAVLGDPRLGEGQNFMVGHCLGYQNDDSKAFFEKFKLDFSARRQK